ncbi:MAG TPA: hypothetical protein VNY04_01030, partial [Chthoniobacterales bacterium]|nr:hypothetical protein [Chthoniobacterales bacterium]
SRKQRLRSKNGVAGRYDLFGFCSSQVRAAVRHNPVGTEGRQHRLGGGFLDGVLQVRPPVFRV